MTPSPITSSSFTDFIQTLQCLLFYFFSSKMLEREEDQLTPATRLLEKRRELAEVEQALATQKEVNLFFLFPSLTQNGIQELNLLK